MERIGIEFNRKNGIFYAFVALLLVLVLFVTLSKKREKTGFTMIEQVKAWKNVDITKYKHSNGLTVILAQQKSVPVFAYYTWFHVGSRHEKKGKTGIAHFFEHLLFKETKNLKEGEFDHLMEENGASTNAATWVDWTYYHETLPSDPQKLELVIRLEADRMRNMILNEKQIESERGVIMNERRYRVDNDVEGSMNEKLSSLAYDVHPYGLPTIGWMEDIQALTLENCVQFYNTYYAPNNATLIIVGQFDKKQTIAWIDHYYGGMTSSKIPSLTVPKEPPQKKAKQLTMGRSDIDVEKGMYAFHATPYGHSDTPALELLAEILFNGEGSRLYKQMIIDEEIVSSLGAHLPHLEDAALFEISVSMRKGEPVQKAHNRIFKEIEKVQDKGVSDEELSRAKNRIEVDYYESLGSVGGKAQALGHYELIAGDYKEALHLVNRYKDVTRKDIGRVAQTYLNATNRTVVVARPKRSRR